MSVGRGACRVFWQPPDPPPRGPIPYTPSTAPPASDASAGRGATPARARVRAGAENYNGTVVCAGRGLPLAGRPGAAAAAARAGVVKAAATHVEERGGRPRNLVRPATARGGIRRVEGGGGGVRRPRRRDRRPGPAAPRGPIPIAGGASGGRSVARRAAARGRSPSGGSSAARRRAPASPASERPERTTPERGSSSAGPCAVSVSTGGAVVGGDTRIARRCRTVSGGAHRQREKWCLQLGGAGHRQSPYMQGPLAALLVAAHPRVALSVGDTTPHGWVPGAGWSGTAAGVPRLVGAVGCTPRPSAMPASDPPRRIPAGVGVGGASDVAVRRSMASPSSLLSPAARAPRRDAQDVGAGGRGTAVEACGTRWVRGGGRGAPPEVERAVACGRRDRSGAFAVSVPAAASSSVFSPGGGGRVAPSRGRGVQVIREFPCAQPLLCMATHGAGRGGAPGPPATDSPGASV